jgi:hypothetical protein
MIKKAIRSVIPEKLFERIQRLRKQGRNFKSLAQNYGQWTTIRDWNSVDEKGQPIPWYTYPTTEFLSHLDLSAFKVFEYGSGNSTLWWSDRTSQITSVEDDQSWYEKIKSSLKNKNVDYRLEKDRQKYFSMADDGFDIFIVDGKYRGECLEHVVKLGGGVMLILDNSDWYPNSVRFLQDKLGWMQADFHGFGPINNYTWTTSIFLNPMRYQELKYNNNLKSKCGLVQVADGDY